MNFHERLYFLFIFLVFLSSVTGSTTIEYEEIEEIEEKIEETDVLFYNENLTNHIPPLVFVPLETYLTNLLATKPLKNQQAKAVAEKGTTKSAEKPIPSVAKRLLSPVNAKKKKGSWPISEFDEEDEDVDDEETMDIFIYDVQPKDGKLVKQHLTGSYPKKQKQFRKKTLKHSKPEVEVPEASLGKRLLPSKKSGKGKTVIQLEFDEIEEEEIEDAIDEIFYFNKLGPGRYKAQKRDDHINKRPQKKPKFSVKRPGNKHPSSVIEPPATQTPNKVMGKRKLEKLPYTEYQEQIVQKTKESEEIPFYNGMLSC